MQLRGRQIQVLSAEDGKLPGLVIADLVAEYCETKLQRAIEHVGLGKPEHYAPRQVSQADLNLQSFSAPQEVVRRVIQTNEGSLQPADAAVQSDAVLAFLFDLERQVHLSIFLIQLLLGHVRIIRLELVEIGKLIQAKQAQLPETGVIYAPLFQSQFAADHLVASRCVTRELDAAHIELLTLVDVNLQIRKFLVVVKGRGRHARVVDVAILAVGLPQSLQPFGDLLAAENISILEREQRAQRSRIGDRFIVLECDLPQAILIAFLDWHRNVHRLAGARLHQRNVDALVSGIVN